MINTRIIELGFWILAFAVLILIRVLTMQYKSFSEKTVLLPVKYFLFGSVLALIFAATPLMLVYADTLWLKKDWGWLIPLAVIGNAISKVISALLLYMIYRYEK